MMTSLRYGGFGCWMAALMMLPSLGAARADGLSRGSLKDMYVEPAVPISWQGFYAGLHGGVLSADTAYPGATTPEQSFDGALLGFQAGYNWQFGRIVIRVEADVAFGELNDFVRDGNSLAEDGEISSFGTVRARLGYAFGNFLPYITGGFIWARLEQGITCPDGAAFGVCAVTGPFEVSVKETMVGWTLGAVVGTSTARVDLDLDYVPGWASTTASKLG